MIKLVLRGNRGTVVENHRIHLIVKHGFIYMDKTLGRRRVDWTGFALTEAVEIRDFFVKGVRALKKQDRFAKLTSVQIRTAARKAAKALPRI